MLQKLFFRLLFVLSIVNLFLTNVFAQDFANNMRAALGSLCAASIGILGVSTIILVVMAAIVYALGQMLGAETRARATVWATAMFTGAIIAAIIFVVVPWVISIMMTGTANPDWVRNCCTENPDADCAGFIGS